MFKTLLKKFSSTFQPEKCKAGEMYSIPNHGKYSIFKVLKVDPKGVHVRLYSNLYAKIPSKINENELYIDNENQAGSKHTPLTFASIKLWEPSFLKIAKVKKDELQDYYSWKYNRHYYV
jgi:hypothetical protein